MRIGIDARCLEWNRGGVARYLINMFKVWQQVDCKDTFVLYFQDSIPEDDFLKNSMYILRQIKGPRFLRTHRILAEQILLPLMVRKDNLDVFFATWYSAPLFMSGVKTVVAAWDISYSTHPQHYSLMNQFSLGYFSRKSCEAAAGVITCSDFDARQIASHYRVPEVKILTVYLAADARFTPQRDEEKIGSVREKYRLPDKFILSMGVIHNRRNVDVLIKAFSNLSEDFPEIGLVVVGRNNTRPYVDIELMIEKLESNGLARYINWFDDEDLVALYQSALYYVCTSTVDGETIMLKEAMKSGVPVITSPLLSGTVGGIGHIIENPESFKDTEKTLREALTTLDARKDLIERGLRWNEQFSWQRVANESLEFLKSM